MEDGKVVGGFVTKAMQSMKNNAEKHELMGRWELTDVKEHDGNTKVPSGSVFLDFR